MDEETKHKHKNMDDDNTDFDQVVEEATGGTEPGEGQQNTMQYVVVGLAVLILLMNIYSIAKINELGVKINSLNKTAGNTGDAPRANATTLPDVASTQKAADPTNSPSTTIKASGEKVEVIVLNDKRCTECAYADDTVTQLKEIFPSLVSTKYDYSTSEGKKLFVESKLKYLPAILFKSDVKSASGYSDISSYLESAGNYLSLRIGASFEPGCYLDNGTIDCTKCGNKTECRAEIENDIQVFIMSDCPYGRQAILALKPVVDNFEDDVTWDVHYIANENNGVFSSLHGQYEVDEDIVQLCVKAYSPDELLDYLYCRATNGVNGVDWHTCAEEADVAIKTVEKCVNGTKGKELLSEDIKIAESLSIGGSPTWLANNRYEFGGIDSETVKTNLCKYNTGLEGCGVTLNSSTGGLSSTGGC